MKYSVLMVCALASSAAATEYGQTVSATDLKAQPSADAAALATLPQNTRVELLKRQGAWYEVKAANVAELGWLRMLNVRGEGGAKSGGGGSGLAALSSMARTGSSGTAVATGVRGLSETDLSNARPDPAELRELEGFAADPQQAREFAAQVPLQAQSVQYLPPPQGREKAK
jgi:hypothetical protein